MDAAAASALASDRDASTTRAPAPASCSLTKYPMPALPPVTTIVLPTWLGREFGSQDASCAMIRP
jgi:hypothetical protein